LFTFKNKTKQQLEQKYSLKQRRVNSDERQSFDASDMIYLLMPDRFANGNTKMIVMQLPPKKIQSGNFLAVDMVGTSRHHHQFRYLSALGATTI
jgi:hypothetical protein